MARAAAGSTGPQAASRRQPQGRQPSARCTAGWCPGAGDLPEDLVAYLSDGAAALEDPLIRRIIPYLISRARSQPELVHAVTGLRGPSRESGRVMLRRPIDRGELPADVDIEIALDLISAPLLMRGIFQGEMLSSGYPERLAAAVLRGIGYIDKESAGR